MKGCHEVREQIERIGEAMGTSGSEYADRKEGDGEGGKEGKRGSDAAMDNSE